MIAALPMYDRAETRAANDRLWQCLRAILGYGPKDLTRDRDLWEIWRAPDLILAQTCGYPFRARLHGHVSLIGTPDYRLPGCPPGYYNSVFLVRRGERAPLESLAKARFAYNDAMSQSGWAAPQNHAAQLGFAFQNLVETGAHRESARAVAEGRADIAALDALSWQLIQRYDAFATDLIAIERTQPTPALPFIAAKGTDVDKVFAALATAIADLTDDDRETLCLHALLRVPASDYLAEPTPPDPAETSAPNY